ncbi:helix-turn-helix domain-containing protein [Arthrobacter sp. B1I2]|uniref:helix-turn-helix domain-containing protein n=1 Tax=Arthrobacter sp. B1I2 TaxID=3042263 RepID=UPI0027D8EE00|nr:helix-turn-helix domain-containing protein [Arthrobacter sp. B1I2]
MSQVADELFVGLPTVRQLLGTGELRGFQVGGRGLWRVAVKDLEDYIERAYLKTAERVATGAVSEEDTSTILSTTTAQWGYPLPSPWECRGRPSAMRDLRERRSNL